VNGQLQQDSNTSEMIFKIDELLEYVSAGITLKPGDLISTGTPFGVAMATGHPYLKDGDLVEGTVERVGTLRNPAKPEM
ncbi:MAG: fumarylacetoacetate hydrolase family protein, partial [Thaumarchaeota archaeon]|nr:fumarylacetoacetate hydrolase family protein [Nitrososphaerota archaeon]